MSPDIYKFYHFCSDQLRKKALQYIALPMVIQSNYRLTHITSNHAN